MPLNMCEGPETEVNIDIETVRPPQGLVELLYNNASPKGWRAASGGALREA